MLGEIRSVIESLDLLVGIIKSNETPKAKQWEVLLRLEIALDQIEPATATPNSPITPALVEMFEFLRATDPTARKREEITTSNPTLTPENIAKVDLTDIGVLLATTQPSRSPQDLCVARIYAERKKWETRTVSVHKLKMR